MKAVIKSIINSAWKFTPNLNEYEKYLLKVLINYFTYYLIPCYAQEVLCVCMQKNNYRSQQDKTMCGEIFWKKFL